jgi:DNA-binding phage protein
LHPLLGNLAVDGDALKHIAATMGPPAIAKHLGIARSSVYRVLEAG